MSEAESGEVDRVTEYARRVLERGRDDRRFIAGPIVRGICRRHLDDLEKGEYTWSLTKANRAIRYFEEVLKLPPDTPSGNPKPFLLEPWQAFVVGSIFGWLDREGQYRRFIVVYVETGKGSGKSPLAAGIGLYMLSADQETAPEIYAAATKRDQAKVLFRDAVAMATESPRLAPHLKLSGGIEKNRIAHPSSRGFFVPIASEDRGIGQSGPRPHCGILDEVHEHPTPAMVEFMRAGTKGRKQPLIFMITNSGSDPNTICGQYHEYSKRLCEGSISDDAFFCYVCALDEGEDPFESEDCWIKVNPSLGVTIPEKYLRDQVHQARNLPSKMNLVKRLNFCIWTDAHTAWVAAEPWKKAEDSKIRVDDYPEVEFFGGLDLSSRRDLTALFLWGRTSDEDRIVGFPYFFVPAEGLEERERLHRVPYSAWADQGYLQLVPGATVNYEWVATFIRQLAEEVRIKLVGYDRWRIEVFREAMKLSGLELPMIECGQGYRDMAPSIDGMEEYLLNGRARIAYNPVMRWNVAGAVISEDPAGNRKFDKGTSHGKIDGVVAAAIAMFAMKSEFKQAESASPYETRGILVW